MQVSTLSSSTAPPRDADISLITSEFIEEFNRRKRSFPWWGAVLTGGLFISAAASKANPIVGNVLFFLSIIATIALFIRRQRYLRVTLHYDLTSPAIAGYKPMVKSARELASSRSWRIIGKTVQQRRNARIRIGLPKHFRSNVPAVIIPARNPIHIFPDAIVIATRRGLKRMDLSRLDCSAYTTTITTAGWVPRGVEIAGKTWQYTNKDGSRNRRRKENREYLICRYGAFSVSPNGVFSDEFHTVSCDGPRKFVSEFRKFAGEFQAATEV